MTKNNDNDNDGFKSLLQLWTMDYYNLIFTNLTSHS